MGSNKQKRYDEEFKSSAVKMIMEKGRAISDVSKSLDISEPALRSWVAAAKEIPMIMHIITARDGTQDAIGLHPKSINNCYYLRLHNFAYFYAKTT